MATRNPVPLQMWEDLPLLCYPWPSDSKAAANSGPDKAVGIGGLDVPSLVQGIWKSGLTFPARNLPIFELLWPCSLISLSFLFSLLGDVCRCLALLLRSGVYAKTATYFLLKKLQVENKIRRVFPVIPSNTWWWDKVARGWGLGILVLNLSLTRERTWAPFPFWVSVPPSVNTEGTVRWLTRF